MKIVEVMPEFGLAGAEIMCENLTEELVQMGFDMTVVSLYDYHSPITERMEAKGIKIIYLKKKPGLDLAMIPRLVKVFRAEKPDVVHTHRYVMQYVIPAAIAAGVKKRFHTVHNIATKETTWSAQKLNMLFYHFCHVTPVALSKEIQATVVARYKLKAAQVPVIYNGIPLEKCLVKSDYAAGDVFEYLHIGRFTAQKNHLMLLKAYKALLDQGVKGHLTLVGTGELEEEVKKQAADLQLEDQVSFFGTTGNVYPLLQKADAFILPSLYEGMPMTLIEAMGSALPIMASRVGGIPSMLEDGKNAVLTEVNEEAITEGMKRLLDENLRKRIGQSACGRAGEAFSARAMAEAYADLFNAEGKSPSCGTGLSGVYR